MHQPCFSFAFPNKTTVIQYLDVAVLLECLDLTALLEYLNLEIAKGVQLKVPKPIIHHCPDANCEKRAIKLNPI